MNIYGFNNELPTFLIICAISHIVLLGRRSMLDLKSSPLLHSVSSYVDSKQKLRMLILRYRRLARYKFILFAHNSESMYVQIFRVNFSEF